MPFLGRVLNEADAAPSSNVQALISFQFWLARFGGQRDALGRVIRLKNFPFVIVGVLPRDFQSADIDRSPDVRLPISAAPLLEGHAIDDPRRPTDENRTWFRILIRLRPGVKPTAIEAAVGESLRSVFCQ